jgi:heptosyltransferase-3
MCRVGRFAEDGGLWRNRLFTHLVKPENESNQYSADHNLNIITPFDLDVKNRLPTLVVPTERKENARIIFAQENVPLDKPIIAIHPFSLWKYKEWAINQWISLIDHIKHKYHFTVIITGSPEERVRAEEMLRKCKTKVFNVAGKTSLGTLPAVLQACRLFIGVDTAALHIGAAVGTPTVSIFGPSSPISWAPRGEQHCMMSKNMSCVPCKQKGCQDSEVSRCLEELTFEEINERLDVHIARTIV